jgi:hypothetical protein
MSGPPRLTQKPLTIAPKARQMTLPRSPVPLIVCVAIIVLRDAFATFMAAVIRSCSRIGTCRWYATVIYTRNAARAACSAASA